MSTRQIRLNTFDQIKNRLKEFSGKKINIVLHDRTVLFGELKSVDNTQLKFVNMRLQAVSLSLHEISEVYLDFNE
jgi:small nuclear ribonucleoprotein (snRNP)-like protein